MLPVGTNAVSQSVDLQHSHDVLSMNGALWAKGKIYKPKTHEILRTFSSQPILH
jgi:hypothetical protein